jgi:dipeptidyl aminopeptidase/acylaminoacyl peptidase
VLTGLERQGLLRPVVLAGTSLGAAVALQEAAGDPRVVAVVAAETFSDLRTIATERSPFVFTAGTIRRAFELAEQEAQFDVDAVSVVVAASRINAPVFLIHGEADTETRSDHSRRVFDALRAQKRLILVPWAGHNGSLRAEVWDEVARWIDSVIPAA